VTIAVAIRTSSSLVFAADSKLTTQGVVGFEEDGTPRWQTQTYDHAVKVIHDRNERLMCMIAGHANIGTASVTDFLSSYSFPSCASIEDQDRAVGEIAALMNSAKREYWETTQVEPAKWPGPTVLLASPSPDGRMPRAWRLQFGGPEYTSEEILKEPNIRLEGSYAEVFSLLYGFHWDIVNGLDRALELPDGRMGEAMRGLNVLRPLEKLNLLAMPVQDAIDLGVFLATVQVQMDRFLPGEPACGGPIDVMVLQMAPARKITSFPGKTLHHPGYNG